MLNDDCLEHLSTTDSDFYIFLLQWELNYSKFGLLLYILLVTGSIVIRLI